MIYVYIFLLIAALVSIVYFFFIRPLGRDFHQRELEMMQRRIKNHEKRRSDKNNDAANDTDADDESGRASG